MKPDSTVVIESSTFTDNKAYQGGVVYMSYEVSSSVSSTTTLSIRRSFFDKNEAFSTFVMMVVAMLIE